jgi:hypothetical protein
MTSPAAQLGSPPDGSMLTKRGRGEAREDDDGAEDDDRAEVRGRRAARRARGHSYGTARRQRKQGSHRNARPAGGPQQEVRPCRPLPARLATVGRVLHDHGRRRRSRPRPRDTVAHRYPRPAAVPAQRVKASRLPGTLRGRRQGRDPLSGRGESGLRPQSGGAPDHTAVVHNHRRHRYLCGRFR